MGLGSVGQCAGIVVWRACSVRPGSVKGLVVEGLQCAGLGCGAAAVSDGRTVSSCVPCIQAPPNCTLPAAPNTLPELHTVHWKL